MRSDAKSAAEHKAAGTYRKDRHKESDLPKERPMRPYKLHKESKKVWDKVVKVMDDANILSKVDALALEMLCDSIVVYRKAHKEIMDNGFTILSASKYGNVTKTNPANSVRNSALTEIVRILKEFGMTPGARGIKPSKGEAKTGVAKILSILNPE